MTTTHDSEGTAAQEVRSRSFSASFGGFEVTAILYELGPDCLVILYGGTRPHIGAVGMGQVRPSLKDPEKISATSSVFTYVGHKEDLVAKAFSEDLTRRLARNTVVAAGIHWDNLSEGGIEAVRHICRDLEEQIAAALITS